MTFRKKIDGTRIDPELLKGDSAYRGTLLVAMPGMHDSSFDKSVIYLCAHSDAGAMGIVVNQPLADVEFNDLMSQMNLPQSQLAIMPTVHLGGPVETGRGFVLHSPDFKDSDTVKIGDALCITGTVDILSAIARGKGPGRSIFALGYAGWAAGQLETEMQDNAWLTVPADDEILFHTDLSLKWAKAMSRVGILNPLSLMPHAGHA